MPIEVAIWNVTDNQTTRIQYSSLESEMKLEDLLMKDISILTDDVLLIGRQIMTKHGKCIDLLGIDVDGNLLIFELKKDKTPRQVTAQVLDYASWVQTLSYEEIVELYEEKNKSPLEVAFSDKFDSDLPEELNSSHQMVIVCAELDHETERIINYLSSNYNVPINAVYFRYFKDGENSYLTRTWLIDPDVTEEKAISAQAEKKKEDWNKRDFAVNFEDGPNRSWKDAVQYGFVAAGNGKWFSRTLKNLFVGARVFCMIPGEGYVGIGTVTRKAVPFKDAIVIVDGKEVRLADCPLDNPDLGHDREDVDKCEYIVGIDWIKTVPKEKAFWVKGLRANQNSAYKLRSQYTIEKVEEYFSL